MKSKSEKSSVIQSKPPGPAGPYWDALRAAGVTVGDSLSDGAKAGLLLSTPQPSLQSRRHFLVTGCAAVGACFLPASLIRRLQDHFTARNELLIEPPDSFTRTLCARRKDKSTWQFSMDYPTLELPTAPSWRVWFRDYQRIDPDNRKAVTAWLVEHQDEVTGAWEEWLETEMSSYWWEWYVDTDYAVRESPEAKALEYLENLTLANGPITDSAGHDVGTLKFYRGPMPGSNWHFVEAEGDLIPAALQHRLRELGEGTEVRIV